MLAAFSASLHCNKICHVHDLKQERFILAHGLIDVSPWSSASNAGTSWWKDVAKESLSPRGRGRRPGDQTESPASQLAPVIYSFQQEEGSTSCFHHLPIMPQIMISSVNWSTMMWELSWSNSLPKPSGSKPSTSWAFGGDILDPAIPVTSLFSEPLSSQNAPATWGLSHCRCSVDFTWTEWVFVKLKAEAE